MIVDFWLGVLACSTVALGVTVTLLASVIAWLARRLAKFANINLTKDKRGGIVGSVDIRP
jgi:hypothetical protein